MSEKSGKNSKTKENTVVKAKITVTKKDINQGLPNVGSSCPIALAASRLGFEDVGVDSTLMFSYSNEEEDYGYNVESYEAKLPKVACKFVDDFDEDKPVKPFSFTVNIPNKIAKKLKLKKKALAAAA